MLALVMGGLPAATNPVVEYMPAVHPWAVPRVSVTVTVPSVPLIVPPGVFEPPFSLADPLVATDRTPSSVVNATAVSWACAGTAIVVRITAVVASTDKMRLLCMQFSESPPGESTAWSQTFWGQDPLVNWRHTHAYLCHSP